MKIVSEGGVYHGVMCQAATLLGSSLNIRNTRTKVIEINSGIDIISLSENKTDCVKHRSCYNHCVTCRNM